MENAKQIAVAVPASADAWTTISTINVPAGAKRIKKLIFGVAPDWGLTAGSVRLAPTFRIQGAGLGEQSPHEYLGQFGGHAEVTTGGIVQKELTQEYEVDIPVSAGGEITVEVNTLDEVVTAGSAIANIIFDDEDAKAPNAMAQTIDVAGTTTADAYASVGTVNIPKTNDAKDPKKIVKLLIAVAPDQGTSAHSLRLAPVVKLSGAGIEGSGDHEYMAKTGFSGEIGTTPSQGVAFDGLTYEQEVDIEINAGGEIDVEHKFVGETPTASTVAVGFIYA